MKEWGVGGRPPERQAQEKCRLGQRFQEKNESQRDEKFGIEKSMLQWQGWLRREKSWASTSLMRSSGSESLEKSTSRARSWMERKWMRTVFMISSYQNHGILETQEVRKACLHPAACKTHHSPMGACWWLSRLFRFPGIHFQSSFCSSQKHHIKAIAFWKLWRKLSLEASRFKCRLPQQKMIDLSQEIKETHERGLGYVHAFL